MKPYILEGTPRDVAQRIQHMTAQKLVAVLVVEENMPVAAKGELTEYTATQERGQVQADGWVLPM